ncbi:hypothetical protein, partial [Actinomyces sp. MRS3W]|uniref:hypothetical protein n=1 Tax=Actinomyces sp. MRS3W TaxID=2800796 RepID=UPI0028FDB2C2
MTRTGDGDLAPAVIVYSCRGYGLRTCCPCAAHGDAMAIPGRARRGASGSGVSPTSALPASPWAAQGQQVLR